MKNRNTHNLRWCTISLAGFVAFLMLTGCTQGPPQSGFLTDYSKLEKLPDDAPVWHAVDPTGVSRTHMGTVIWADLCNVERLGDYDKFMADPPVVQIKKGSSGTWVHPERINKLANAMTQSLIDALDDKYPKVDKPGPGVVRFRGALTNVSPAILYEQPYARASVRWANSSPGGATFEAEVVDSVTGERLWAIVAEFRGSKLGTLTTEDVWENARKGADQLAQFVRKRMDEEHQKKQ